MQRVGMGGNPRFDDADKQWDLSCTYRRACRPDHCLWPLVLSVHAASFLRSSPTTQDGNFAGGIDMLERASVQWGINPDTCT